MLAFYFCITLWQLMKNVFCISTVCEKNRDYCKMRNWCQHQNEVSIRRSSCFGWYNMKDAFYDKLLDYGRTTIAYILLSAKWWGKWSVVLKVLSYGMTMYELSVQNKLKKNVTLLGQAVLLYPLKRFNTGFSIVSITRTFYK